MIDLGRELREAIINFECHNRRQLQVLEALYMRPGYLVLLEWGWTPYVHSEDGIETDVEGIARKFLDPTKLYDNTSNLFNRMNLEIIKKKKLSEGNYDGFIGVIKNFKFTSKSDGGYKCTTELIAQGEIMESLRSTKRFIESEEFEIISPEGGTEEQQSKRSIENRQIDIKKTTRKEIIDNFLLILKSIKAVFDKAGDEFYLQVQGVDAEMITKNHGDPGMEYTWKEDAINYEDLQEISPKYEEAFYLVDKLIKDISKLNSTDGIDAIKADKPKIIDGGSQRYGWVECVKELPSTGYSEYVYYGPNNLIKDYDDIRYGQLNSMDYKHTELIWNACKGPGDGGKENIDYVPAFSTYNKKYIKEGDTVFYYQKIEKELNETNPDPSIYPGPDGYPEGRLYKWTGLNPAKDEFEKGSIYNKQESGLIRFYEGLIVQQIAKYISNYDSKNNSGFRKNIFVRWDLVCQIFNHLAVDKIGINGEEEPIVEMTYLAPNQQTYDFSSDEKINNTDKDGEVIDLKEYIRYSPPELRPTIPGEESALKSTAESFVGVSLNEKICILPHQKINYKDWSTASTMDLTSYKEVDFDNTGIGGVLINLDFLISTYEKIATTNNESTQTQRMKPTINFNKYFNTIWEGVNEATGFYYDFGLHIEHERPHVGRILDFKFGGETRHDDSEELFEFKPQLDGSIIRDFNFNSEIPSDMSSVISIAAQSPNNANDLDALSFKAFHKGIYSRFSSTPLTDEELLEEQTTAKDILKEDVNNYLKLRKSLREHTVMFNNSRFVKIVEKIDENNKPTYKSPLTGDKASSYIEDLEELRISIENKFPLYEMGGKKEHPKAGLSRPDTTYHRSAILPIKFDVQLDGIGGITPLTLFKIHKDVLPIGYQSNNIIFIVKEEIQRITKEQDWITEFNGQLVLKDTNPNYEGQNLSEEMLGEIENENKLKLDELMNTETNQTRLGLEEEYNNTFSDYLGDNKKVHLVDPLQKMKITSKFGRRLTPNNANGNKPLYEGHQAIDLRARTPLPTVAVWDGVVVKAHTSEYDPIDKSGGCGGTVKIRFDNPHLLASNPPQGKTVPMHPPHFAVYCHLSKIHVEKNQKVTKGMEIGLTGGLLGEYGAGNSTDRHLHFALKLADGEATPPAPWLPNDDSMWNNFWDGDWFGMQGGDQS